MAEHAGLSGKEAARRLADLAAREGGSVWYVGGCVRDALLGLESKDVDVEVHGLPPERLEALLDQLGVRMEVGKSFGVYQLKGVPLDIALPRRETPTGRGHRDFTVTADPWLSLTDAARRRDFTMNAMMREVRTDELFDPFGGAADLKARRLRHVCDETFPEDPLRVLRGAQFAARFDLTMTPETATLCRRIPLDALSPERVEGELRKALCKAARPSQFFTCLRQVAQLSVWFPEAAALMGVAQNPVYHGEGDVWEHTMLVLDAAAALREQAEEPYGLMLSALVHDFGKPETTRQINGVLRAFGHETAGLAPAESFLRRLTRERELLRYALNMTRLHMRPNLLARDNASLRASNRLFDEAVCPGDLLLLALADDRGRRAQTPVPDAEPWLRERLAHYRALMARPWFSGQALLDGGVSPGPALGAALQYAHTLRLSGVTREEALKQTLAHAATRRP